MSSTISQTKPAEPLPGAPRTSSERFGFMDWARGMATLVMLQGHVWESFTAKDLRDTGVYQLSQFPGGVAPAVFLFLAGVTLAFLVESRERRGHDARERMFAALRRAAYLGGLALLFRLQMYVSYWPYGAVKDLLRVDILNCMAATCLMLAPIATLRRMWRVRGAMLLALAIAFGAPFVSDWSADAPNEILRSYLAPNYTGFALFPWGTFVAFGMACGSIWKLVPEESREQLMQWVGWGGFVLTFACQYLSNLPYGLYPRSEFWLDSPCLTLIKCGVILMVISFSFFWNEWMPRLRHNAGSDVRFSIPKLLGTNSLFIYWVHIEIVYGRWFEGFKQKTSLGHTALFAIAVVFGMIGLTYLKAFAQRSEPYLALRRRLGARR